MEQVKFGRYPQTADGDVQPIEWLALKREGNKALLVSRYALDCVQYNDPLAFVMWETCTLRKWLNGEFLNAAFTPEEKASIVMTKVVNPNNPCSNAPGGADTDDNAFLLSIEEAQALFPYADSRRCAPTPFANKRGCWVNNSITTADGELFCWWWLRSPGFSSRFAAYVRHDGFVREDGDLVSRACVGVRPALWVNLESEIFNSKISGNMSVSVQHKCRNAFRLNLSCPECGNTTWYDVVDSEGAFECAACGTVSLPEEMGTKSTESLPFGRWIRPEGSTRGSYKFQCSVCGQISHQVTGNNGRKVKEDNPKCTYRFCPWCMTPMSN